MGDNGVLDTVNKSTIEYRLEFLGDDPVFTVEMLIYHCFERIGELLLPLIFHTKCTTTKNNIQMN